MQPYKELGNELDRKFSAILFLFVGQAQEDWLEWLNNTFFSPLGGGFFLYLGNSVFVDPIRGPNKTLSKNNNKIVDRLPTFIGRSVPKP